MNPTKLIVSSHWPSIAAAAMLMTAGSAAQAAVPYTIDSAVNVPPIDSLLTGGSVNIIVGNTGIGTLTITPGGAVLSGCIYTNSFVGQNAIGAQAGSTGIVTIDGVGASWSTNCGSTVAFKVGIDGNGTLTLSNGGILQLASYSGIWIATGQGKGTLNIGASLGQAPKAPGILTGYDSSVSVGPNGTLVFNHTSTNYSFSTCISGGGVTGGAVKQEAGTTVLNPQCGVFSNEYNGPTFVDGGVLKAGSGVAFSGASSVTVATDGTLDLNGYGQSAASLTNAGTVNIPGTQAGAELKVGNYTGKGGTIKMNVDVTQQSYDKLTITNILNAGVTTLNIHPLSVGVTISSGFGVVRFNTLDRASHPADPNANFMLQIDGYPTAPAPVNTPVTVNGYTYTLVKSNLGNQSYWDVQIAAAPAGGSTTGSQGSGTTTGSQGSGSTTGSGSATGSGTTTGSQGSGSTTGSQGGGSTTGSQGGSSTTGSQGSGTTTGGQGSGSTTGGQGSGGVSFSDNPGTGSQGSGSTTGSQGSGTTTGSQGSGSTTGSQGSGSTATGGQSGGTNTDDSQQGGGGAVGWLWGLGLWGLAAAAWLQRRRKAV